MNFRDFVKRDNTRRVQPEPEELEEEYIDEPEEEVEDMDYEDEEEYYEEPPRPVQRVVRPEPKVQPRQVQRPAPVRQSQPMYRPQPRPIQRQAMPVEQYNRPIQISKKQLSENTIESTANTLTEAIKRKVDTIFYRFGIQGLEKLDEKILDTIEELQYPEPKQIKKSGVNMRRVPARKVVRKPKPLPIQEIKPPVYEEPIEEVYEEQLPPEPIYEEVQEPIQEPVEEPVEEVVEETPEPVQENKEPDIFELANQLLDIEPEKEMVHEAKGSNPVFDEMPSMPTPAAKPAPQEPVQDFNFEVPPVESPKLVTMPSLDEAMKQTDSVELAEVPTEAPATKKSKKKKATSTNEEK